MDIEDLRTTFIITQVAGERLAYKTLNLSGKTKLRLPSVVDMTRRYAKLYDNAILALKEVDAEGEEDVSV
jgi:hypothetical protein